MVCDVKFIKRKKRRKVVMLKQQTKHFAHLHPIRNLNNAPAVRIGWKKIMDVMQCTAVAILYFVTVVVVYVMLVEQNTSNAIVMVLQLCLQHTKGHQITTIFVVDGKYDPN